MKTKFAARYAYFNPRALIGFVLCSVGALLALAGLSKSVTDSFGNPVVKTGMVRHNATAQTPGTWTATGSMSTARYRSRATPLNNGKILVTGGVNASGTETASAELYDPSTGLWTPTGSMTAPRAQHTATLLTDGKVLVAGGENTTTVNSSAELYDPGTGLWTPTGSMSIPRSSHMGTLITGGPLSGTVIVAGGSSEKGGGGINLSAELYDPDTGLWADTGSMRIARYFDEASPTALPDGSILIVGGTTCCPYHWFNEAELYDSVSQTWTPTSGKTTPANGRAVLLQDGKVLVAGGVKGTQPTSKNVADAELFDPVTGTWAATASMSTDRDNHTLTLLASGQALVAGGLSGGWGVCNDLTSAELYDSSAGTWFLTGNTTVARAYHTATMLPNGQVLAAGGLDCEGNVRSSAELYTPPNAGNACLPPPAGLVSWWSGDKTAEDVQGANPGVLKNGASFRPGKVGPGFVFDGIDDAVVIPNSASLSQPRITLDAWVYPTGKQGTNRHIISKDNDGGTREYVLGATFIDKFTANIWLTGGVYVEALGTTPIQLNTWYHVAMTHDGTKLDLYVNGVLEATSEAMGDRVPSVNPVGIGGNVSPVFFQGVIDEAQIFDRALTDAEILAIYQAGADGQCKPNIFVASIDPSFRVRGNQYLISTSVMIQDVNGVGIEDARVQIATTFPDGQVLTFPVTTDQTGQATLTLSTTSTGLYEFKVRKVTHPTREYDASLNIETSDTLLIP